MKKTTIFKILAALGLALFIISIFFGHPEAGFAVANAALVIQFHKDAEEHLYPNNEFLYASVDDTPFLNGKTVTRGVAGDDPEGVTNPTQWPLEVSEREDDENSYDIALHATKPVRLGDVEDLELNYPKRQSIITQHTSFLNTLVANEFAYNWSPTNSRNLINTSGADIDSKLPGTTGKRKAPTANDIIDAVQFLSSDDAKSNLYGLVSSFMYGSLLKIPDFIDYNKTGRVDLLAKGIIGEVCGVKFFERSRAGIYTKAGARKKISAAVAEDDNECLLIWSADKVYRALGNHEVYINAKLGQYLGSTINMSTRAGGKLRKDQKGVVSLIQG